MHVFTVLKRVNRLETYFVVSYAYFTAEQHQILKTFGQFENLVFVIICQVGKIYALLIELL